MASELSPAQRQFWEEEYARQEIRRADYQRYMEEAREARDRAAEELGLIRRIGRVAVEDELTESQWLGNE